MSLGSSTAGSQTHYGMEETRFLKRTRAIHPARLFLSVLIFSTAITIIACEAVPFQHYKNTSQWASSGLALWPLNLDNRPTVAALSCGCVISFLNLIYIVAALLPTVSILSTHVVDKVELTWILIIAAFAHQSLKYMRLDHRSHRVYNNPHWPPLHHLPSRLNISQRLHRERNPTQLDLQVESSHKQHYRTH